MPSSKLLGEAEVKFAIVGQHLGIWGPHPFERLAHRAEDVLHPISCDGLLAGSNVSLSVTHSKDLDKGDLIPKAPEERIDPEFLTKLEPNLPMGILCLGSFRVDSIDDGFLNNNKVISECILEFSWQARHDAVCGKW